MKKILIIIIITISLCVHRIFAKPYDYNIDRACDYLTENALSKSHCCCAWFVMRAMQEGGCPIGIAPAWYYKYLLPKYNFKEVDSSNNYAPKKGDIIVIEKSENHIWGHIAMYNGKQWISDFKQKNMNPYKNKYPYVIFRYNY